jgi:hypothetical protein
LNPKAKKRMTTERDTRARLQAELGAATAQLRTHMESWEYAFAMGGGRDGASHHPVHWETNARTARLEARCRDLRTRLAEFES